MNEHSGRYQTTVPFTPSELMMLHGLTVSEALGRGLPVVGYTRKKAKNKTASKVKKIEQLTQLSLLGSREAAELIGVDPITMSWYCTKGKIKATKIGRFWGIERAELDQFKESRR